MLTLRKPSLLRTGMQWEHPFGENDSGDKSLSNPKQNLNVVMVKTTSTSSFEHQRFALHMDQFSRRFVVHTRKPRPAIPSSVSPMSSSTHNLNCFPLLPIQDWATDFDMLERSQDTTCQDSSKPEDKMSIQNILEDPTPIVQVPQNVWDDLFDKALQALNSVPVDEDAKI